MDMCRFQFLANMKKATMNMDTQIFEWTNAFMSFGQIPGTLYQALSSLSPKWLYASAFPPPTLSSGRLFNFSHSTEGVMISRCSFSYISLMTSNGEHPLTWFLIIPNSSFVKCLFKSFAHFLVVISFLIIPAMMNYFYVLDSRPFQIHISHLFALFAFRFLKCAFWRANVFKTDDILLILVLLTVCVFCVCSVKEILL